MRFRLVTAAVLALGCVTAASSPAQAAPSPTGFPCCAALHRVYPAGVAKVGVRFNTVHSGGRIKHRALRGHVMFGNALYAANAHLGRDQDGIACERS